MNPAQFIEQVANGQPYETDEPIVLAGGMWVRRWILDRLPVQIIYTGGRGKGPVLTIGSEWSTFTLGRIRQLFIDCPNGADCGIQLYSASRMRMEHIGVVGADIGFQLFRGYWNTLTHPYIRQCDVGIRAGIGEGSSSNTFHIIDGQVVNSRIGVHMSQTVGSIENLDCSNCSEHAVLLQGSQDIDVTLYSEGIGSPDTADDSVVKLVNCKNIHLFHLLNAGNRASYGIDALNCQGVYNQGRIHMPRVLPIRAVDCSDVWDHERQVA